MHDQHLDRDRDSDKAGPRPEDLDLDADAGASDRSKSFLARETGAEARAKTTDASAQDSEVSSGLVDKMVGSPTTDLPHGDAYGSGASSVVAHGGPELRSEMSSAGIEGLTYGNHVAFSSSSPGRDVVQHELAHVAQQSGGGAGSRADDEAGASRAESMSPSAIGAALGGGAAAAPIARARKPDPAKPKRPPGFEVASGPPGGELVKSVKLDLPDLPADLRAGIEGEPVSVKIALLVDGDTAIVHIDTGDEHWVARASATEVANALFGPLATEALEMLGKVTGFIEKLKTSGTLQGTKIRLDLWKSGTPEQQSFATIDLAKVASGLGRGSASGFRPVEARILAGDAGGIRIFNEGQVPLTEIGGSPIGDWFPIPDEDGTIHKVLGVEGKGNVTAGVFYEGGVLSVAIKENAEAKTGIAASLNLEWLLEKLKQLGGKALKFLDGLLAKIKAGAIKLFDVVGGLLKFDFPDLGGFLEFDFKLQLPRLFKGGGGGGWGFSLSGLWPSGFSFELGGGSLSFGALPRMRFPWLKMPKLGSFDVSFDKLKGLLGELPDLPKLPSFDVDLHFAGDLSLGLSIDLSKLWPDFGGGDAVFGFTIDLGALLDKFAGAGQWLLDKLRKLKNWFNRYIHLGRDGVLRIYDAQDDRALIGFHLLRLLDGAQPEDLVPVEIRWEVDTKGKKDLFDLEVGEAAPDDGSKPGGPKDKTSPVRPGGTPKMTESIDAPADLVTAMALDPGAAFKIEVFADTKALTLWAEAPSAVFERSQAIRAHVPFEGVAELVQRKLPAGGSKRGSLPVEPVLIDGSGMIRFTFGKEATDADKDPSGARGEIAWKVGRLLTATDLFALVPDVLNVESKGVGGIQLGQIAPKGKLIGGRRFEMQSEALRQKLLLAGDTRSDVHGGINVADDLIGVSLTKEAGGDEGALAEVHLSFLLRQLERLGALGKRILEWLADKLPSGGGERRGGDIFGRIAEIAQWLIDKIKDIAGALEFDLGGGSFLRWNLEVGLPSLGELDLTKLIPDFSIPFPKLPDLSLSFLRPKDFGIPGLDFGVDLSKIGKWLDGVIDGLPGFDLSKLKDFRINVDFSGDLLGIWFNLGDLFGDGERAFGFRFPMSLLLEKFKSLGKWFDGALTDVAALRKYLHLGPDGVLRVHDSVDGNRAGFDLKRLLDGADLTDLVPVELHLAVSGKGDKPLASLDYGDRTVDDKDTELKEQHGKVLVPPPSTPVIARANPKAPEFLTEYFGAAKGAVIPLSLHSDGTTADLYASMPNSDRAANVHLDVQNIASAVEKAGPLKAPEGEGVAIDKKRSKEKGALVVTFGAEKKPDEKYGKGEFSGYLAWKLDTLVAGEGLAKLVPDELHIENDKGELSAGTALTLKGMKKRVDFAVPDWAQGAVGATTGEVWTNDLQSSKNDLRVALVEGGDEGRATARGVELDLRREFVDKVEERLQKLANEAQSKVGKALKRARGAGRDVGEMLTKKNISLEATSRGVRVQRGKDGEADHVYATFGWENFMNLANGKAEAADLLPDEFRVATKAVSLEVEDLPTGAEGEHPPEGSRQIGTMHALLREPLVSLGLNEVQWLRIDADNSHADTQNANEEYHPVKLAAMVYDVDSSDPDRENVTVTDGKMVTVSVSLEALLAQVLPKGRKLLMDKKQRQEEERKARQGLKPGEKSVHAGIGFSDDFSSVDMHVGLDMKSRKINKKTGDHTTRHFALQAGWTIKQIIEAIENLDKMIDDEGKPTAEAAGLLIPEKIVGSYDNEQWKLEFGTVGGPSEYNVEASKVPLLPDLLGELLDPTTAKKSKIHLSLPDKGELASKLKDAFWYGDFVPLVGCSLEVPIGDGETRFYGVMFSASPDIFKRLAQFIPYVGIVVKLASIAEGFINDPMGTIEGIAYTPEAMYHFVRNFPDIIENLGEMSFEEIAMGLVMNDATAKQAAMAGRLLAKIKDDPAYKEMKRTKKFKNAHGASAEFLEWMSEQSEDALSEMMKLSLELEAKGITLDGNTQDVPTGTVNPFIVKMKIQMVKSGYEDYATAMDAVENATTDDEKKKAQENVDAKAKNLLAAVEVWTNAGAKKSGRFEDPRKADAEIPEATAPDYQPTDIHGMPEATEEQEEQARKLFPPAEAGDQDKVLSLERDYLVGKYGHLATEQLAELLMSGKTMVKGGKAHGDFELVMLEPERPFVRNLFLLRVDPTAEVVKPGEGDKMDPLTDAELVEKWKKNGFQGKGVRPGEDTPKEPPRPRGSDGDGDGTGAKGDDGGGGPAGDAGTYEEGGDGSGMDEDTVGLDDDYADEEDFQSEESEGEGEGGEGGDVEVGETEDEGGDAGADSDAQDLDPEKHVISFGYDGLRALLQYDAPTDTWAANPDSVAKWKTMKGPVPPGADGKAREASVQDVLVDQLARHGAGDDAQYMIKVEFKVAFNGQYHHSEKFTFAYSKKTDKFFEMSSDEKLLSGVAAHLEVDGTTVKLKKGSAGNVDTGMIRFQIISVVEAAQITNGYDVVLSVAVPKDVATDNDAPYVVRSRTGSVDLKKSAGGETEIVLPFYTDSTTSTDAP